MDNKSLGIMLIILNIVLVILSGYLGIHYLVTYSLEHTASALVCGILWSICCGCWVATTIFNVRKSLR